MNPILHDNGQGISNEMRMHALPGPQDTTTPPPKIGRVK